MIIQSDIRSEYALKVLVSVENITAEFAEFATPSSVILEFLIDLRVLGGDIPPPSRGQALVFTGTGLRLHGGPRDHDPLGGEKGRGGPRRKGLGKRKREDRFRGGGLGPGEQVPEGIGPRGDDHHGGGASVHAGPLTRSTGTCFGVRLFNTSAGTDQDPEKP